MGLWPYPAFRAGHPGKAVTSMNMDQKQQIALFRYGVISPLETGPGSGQSDPLPENGASPYYCR